PSPDHRSLAQQMTDKLTPPPDADALDAVFQELTTEITRLRTEQGQFILFAERLDQQQARQQLLEEEVTRLKAINQGDNHRKQTTVRALLQEAGLDPDALE
ncbi:hypothetical protein, partial [Candidatus Cyanaurora vandensis]|uniref:hypothetical protein n=1 Tax=Candidatus Cyanaurora vandensis TaxID=2714958 RepID=UPI00257E2CBE